MSPLNKPTGQMYDTTWTWNPFGGVCPHKCSYCLPEGTKILMDDFSLKAIEKIKMGDKVVGLQESDLTSGYRRYTPTIVTELFKRRSKTIIITTDKGVLECTPEHPLLGGTSVRQAKDWRQAKAFTPYEYLRYLGQPKRNTKEYLRGWLTGYVEGDGSFFNYQDGKYLGFEAVSIDKEIREALVKRAGYYGIFLKEGIKRTTSKSFSKGKSYPMIFTRQTKEALKLRRITEFSNPAEKDFCAGYIGGMIDAEGNIGTKQICMRITNFDETINEHLQYCLDQLEYDWIDEKNTGKGTIRITGGFPTRLRLLFECRPVCTRKREKLLFNHSLKNTPRALIQRIEIGGEKPVYNLETECGNYIANGFIVHNCYAHNKIYPWQERLGNKKYRGSPYLVESELKTRLVVPDGFMIFIQSLGDLFAWNVLPEHLHAIFTHCMEYPETTFLIQSKNPARMLAYLEYFKQMKVVLGTTISTNRDYHTYHGKSPSWREDRQSIMRNLRKMGFKVMVSVEPIMAFDHDILIEWFKQIKPKYVSIGADSGGNGLEEPTANEIEYLIIRLSEFTVVKVKPNLKRLYDPEKLIAKRRKALTGYQQTLTIQVENG